MSFGLETQIISHREHYFFDRNTDLTWISFSNIFLMFAKSEIDQNLLHKVGPSLLKMGVKFAGLRTLGNFDVVKEMLG